jgi:RNA polymerase sigma-70 factor (ECF subfamily)
MPSSPSAAPETGLETIYRRHQGLVRWVLRARGVPEGALEDHVHDVFLAILRRLPERDLGVPMRAWVAGVARNVSFSHRRTMARQRSRALRLVPPDDPPRPDEELERREAWQALSAFLDDLGPEQREVFVMVEVTGMRVSEVAETMGMPANTLHSRLKVARTRFSERFEGPSEQRAALVQRAREQGRAEPKERRRTWAMIAASIEGLPALPAAGATAGASAGAAWMVGGSKALTAVTLAVGVLGAAAVVGARSPARERSGVEMTRNVETSRAGSVLASGSGVEPAAAPALVERPVPMVEPDSTEPATARERTRSRSSAARPTDASAEPDAGNPSAAPVTPPSGPTDAELLRAMSAVEKAREALSRGQARRALAALDDHAASFGMLERERRRLELDAACRLDDGSRARRAAAALVGLGAAIDASAPCAQDVD